MKNIVLDILCLVCLLLAGVGNGEELQGYVTYKMVSGNPEEDMLNVSFKLLNDHKEPISLDGRILISVGSQRRAIDSDNNRIRTGSYDIARDITSDQFIVVRRPLPEYLVNDKPVIYTTVTSPTFTLRAGDFYIGKENLTTGDLERVSCYPWEEGTVVFTFIPKDGKPLYDVESVTLRDRQTDKDHIPTGGAVLEVIKRHWIKENITEEITKVIVE
jgi:hypothetical protein